jgi:bifunctional non-homologous end joining protein LigD
VRTPILLAADAGSGLKSKIPFRVHPMLATLVDKPFHEEGWVYEEKYDGIRILAYKEGQYVSLLTRNDIDRTANYTTLAASIRALPAETLLLDGEVIAFDRKQISRFQLLQQGSANLRYAAFDCLYVDGRDLRHEPLSRRREYLEKVLTPTRQLMLSRRLAKNGLEAYKVAKQKGFEGLVAKRLSSLYIEKRTREWLKVKVNQADEFVIVGFTEPKGERQYFGALLLAGYKHGQLVYAGRVGTGFDRNSLASLYRKFQPLIRKKPAFADVPRAKAVTFLAPKLVAQISFTEWTEDGRLRHPVYLGLRDDKTASEVVLPEGK